MEKGKGKGKWNGENKTNQAKYSNVPFKFLA
jgi:hypothetical protein